MLVKDLLIALALVLAVFLSIGVSALFGSEHYCFVPRGFDTLGPPTPPFLTAALAAIPVGIWFFSKEHAWYWAMLLPILLVMGLLVGPIFFRWIPGVAHFLILITSTSLALYVWRNEDLRDD